MASRIVIDPITRIEGHLRVEVEVQNGKVVDAYSSGTMVRGFEIILKGRDPRDAWAFTERACGVCTTVHALASVRTVEDALGITVPPNAELVRNLMFCTQYMQDHVVHFYHLHALDWVDIVSALKADPKKTSELAQSISNWPKSSPAYFSDLQKRLTAFVNSGQLGIFANGYWGHGAYKLPPEVNLIGTAHYLEALEWQKEIVKIHTIFGLIVCRSRCCFFCPSRTVGRENMVRSNYSKALKLRQFNPNEKILLKALIKIKAKNLEFELEELYNVDDTLFTKEKLLERLCN